MLKIPTAQAFEPLSFSHLKDRQMAT